MERFFSPQSIALVGASKTPGKVGYSLRQKLKPYHQPVYPVNPHFGHARVTDIPGPVDLAVIAVPAPAVPGVVADCVSKQVRGIIVISAGFAEAGKQGVVLASPPVPLLGPNCFGIANPALKLDTTFAKTPPPPGNIGLISQSGALASYLFGWAKEERLGFSKFVSLGNRLSLTETDFLDYLANDPATKVIGLYLESFADGTAWLASAGRASRKKPVIVLFGGRTAAGRKASLSHTASLSPPGEVISTALSQSGCFQAKTITDLTTLLEIFSLEPGLKDNDLAVITNAGGPAILAVDTAASLAFDVAKPIDVLGDARAGQFKAAFNQALADKTKDAFLIIITPQAGSEISKTCRAIVNRFKTVNKPLVVSLLGGRLTEPARQILKKNRIATLDLPQQAARALAALLAFHRRRRPVYPVRRIKKPAVKPACLPPGRLDWRAAQKLARAYQIPLAKTVTLKTPAKPAGLNWPMVLKADPALTGHRTEAKGIALNLNSPAALQSAYRRLAARFPVILAQQQLESGFELFIGLRRDPGWPPLLTFGGGGLYTELYRDLARTFLPVNTAGANRLLRQTRIGQIIFGWRTGMPLAVKPVIGLILNSCRLMEAYPLIEELEINPAIVTAAAVSVVDLKMTSGTLPEVG